MSFRYIESERGFRYYLQDDVRVVSESSVIRDYPDAWENPGSSCLWLGEGIELDREGVVELIRLMQFWLEHKRLPEGGQND